MNHLLLAPPFLLLTHKNTSALYMRILDAPQKFSLYSVTPLRGGHVEFVTWGVGTSFLCCFGLTGNINICNLRFRSSGKLRCVDLLPVETALCPRRLESSAVPLRRNQNLYTKLTRIQGVTGGTNKFREGVPYVKLYRYNPKHLYPKLNGYGDNGK